ncbi:STM3941 family protein [Flavobacterium procerum]|uniref:STM3941 family protein n=1 Tax=Flavobacterium procerum TaxID=1455569 RepID=A0ABV6BMW4_9FLAO
MSPENQIEIPLSKKKMYLILAISILFVCLGIWFLTAPPTIDHPIYGNPKFIFSCGIASIVFFGYAGFSIFKKLGDKKPGLLINSEGITDNSSNVAAGLILWSDIIRITTANVMNQKFLIIKVKNPNEYINRQNGILKRKTVEMNYKTYGSPISISANTLDTNFVELYNLLQRKFEENKI